MAPNWKAQLLTYSLSLCIGLISQSVGVCGELGIDTKQRFRGSNEHSSNPENPVLHLTHSLTHSLLTHLLILAISLISQSISLISQSTRLSVGVRGELGIDTKQRFRGCSEHSSTPKTQFFTSLTTHSLIHSGNQSNQSVSQSNQSVSRVGVCVELGTETKQLGGRERRA